MAGSVTATTYPSARNDSTESLLESWVSSVMDDGVVWTAPGNQLAAFADSTGMQIKLPSGGVSLGGIRGDLSAQQTLAIDPADATNPRIDTLVAELKRTPSPYTIRYFILNGTAAASPGPTVPTSNATYRYLPLAYIRVDAGVTTIAANKVTLIRKFSGRTDWTPWTPAVNPASATTWTVATDYTSFPGLTGRYRLDGMTCHFRWSCNVGFSGTGTRVGLAVKLPVQCKLPETEFFGNAQSGEYAHVLSDDQSNAIVIPNSNWIADGLGRFARIAGSFEIALS